MGALESEFAGWCGAKNAFATTRCATAMHVATQAPGIGEGDEVIVTPNTFVATTLVILKESGHTKDGSELPGRTKALEDR